MLGKWIEIMPLFVVRWLARRHCERVTLSGVEWHTATSDVAIRSKG